MISFFKLLRTFDFHELNLDGFFANLHIENFPFVWYPKCVGNENTNEKKATLHQNLFAVCIYYTPNNVPCQHFCPT